LVVAPAFNPISSLVLGCARLLKIGPGCARRWPNFGPLN
jgi:hypothetical protein